MSFENFPLISVISMNFLHRILTKCRDSPYAYSCFIINYENGNTIFYVINCRVTKYFIIPIQ